MGPESNSKNLWYTLIYVVIYIADTPHRGKGYKNLSPPGGSRINL